MSINAERLRLEERDRERALLAMREPVAAAISAYHPRAGSSSIFEAVDEALAQLVAAGGHLDEAEHVKAAWILYAKRRLIDEYRSAEQRHREPVSLDHHAQALAMSVSREPELVGEDRQWWRVHEILSVLRDDHRTWAEAWYDQVLAGHSQPRGLDKALGWSASKTEKVSQRARRKMTLFLEQRRSGAICSQQRAVLNRLSLDSGGFWHQVDAEIDDERYRALLFHVAGCEDCWVAWHTRRRSPLGRCAAILTLPLSHVAAAAAALRARLAGLAGSAHGATHSLRQRAGIGGGASVAATGGGVATFGGKAAAICGAVVCAAGAGGGALISAVPAILPHSARHIVSHRVARHAKQDSTPGARLASYTPPVLTPPPVVKDPVPTPTAPAPAAAAPAASSPDPTYTPGDLPPATTSSSAPSTSSAPSSSSVPKSATRVYDPPPPASNASSCVPGDLAC